jgi:hypothetical protein
LGEVSVDAPVALLIRVGQRAPGNGPPDAHVVELVRDSAQAGLDVAQAFTVGELGKCHDQELVAAGEGADTMVATIAANSAVERKAGSVLQQLREERPALMHRRQQFSLAGQ